MGVNISRSVEIEVSNKTKNIVLRNPRTFFFSGHSLKSPEPSVPPGSSTTCRFTNNTWFWGCNGVLAFETEPFTLAIFFSNPVDYNRFCPETGLELSQAKVHKGNLEVAYDRLVRISRRGDSFVVSGDVHSSVLKESQEQVQLSVGPVKVTATMSRVRNAMIRVKVEEESSTDREPEARAESPGRAWQVEEK